MENPHHISEDLEKIKQRLEFENQELKIEINELRKRVKDMLAAKEVWLKDQRNSHNRTIFFKSEGLVKDLVFPKQKSQATLEWLRQ